MAKVGRRPTPQKEQVTVIRLKNKHIQMLDEVIRDRVQRDLAAVQIEPERQIPGTNVTTFASHIEPIDYSKERRDLVATLIEQALKEDALYPTRVLPTVPRGPYSSMDMVEISSWAGTESKRLTESAPGTIQEVLARNRLRKMKREMPREEYLKRLKVVTYTMSEEGDDDKKAP